MNYQNKNDGFFKEVIGSHEDNVYMLFSDLYGNDSRLKIVAFDKNSLEKKASVAIVGFKENKPNYSEYRGLDMASIVVLKENIYVFWTKLTNTRNVKKEELFVESFDMNLDRKEELKLILTADYDEDRKLSSSASFMTVLTNDKAGEFFVVGYEEQKEGENVQFNYALVNEEFDLSDIQSIELPIVSKGKRAYGTSSYYTLGDDGNVYIRSTISLSKEERKNLPSGTSYSYSVFTAVNPENNNSESFELRADNTNINDFMYKIIDGKIKIYGFFCDLIKDPKGNSSHGIFHVEMNGTTLEASDLQFTYFEKSFLNELFKDDKEDKKRTAGSKKKREKARANDDESLDERFIIEDIFVDEKGSVVLFCSKMYNYSVTTCTQTQSGGQTCTTRYYCQKSNVTVIRLSEDDEIVWASNLDRLITYSGWDKLDVNVVKKENKFYVIYGSAYVSDASKKSGKSAKKRSDARDSFEYAIFDAENGKYEKNTFQVNAKDIEKKERKTVNPLMIQVVDDEFYVSHVRVKPMSYLCCGYILLFAPGAVKADGCIGKISVIGDGGSKRKKRK
jgi:hypothetical protein